MEASDARSILVLLASYYHQGVREFLFQDQEIAMELWKKAAKLGSIWAHFFLGNEYDAVGDLKKAKFHWKENPFYHSRMLPVDYPSPVGRRDMLVILGHRIHVRRRFFYSCVCTGSYVLQRIIGFAGVFGNKE